MGNYSFIQDKMEIRLPKPHAYGERKKQLQCNKREKNIINQIHTGEWTFENEMTV